MSQFSKDTVQRILEQLEGVVVASIPAALSNNKPPGNTNEPIQCKKGHYIW